jgi:hypothetical protein
MGKARLNLNMYRKSTDPSDLGTPRFRDWVAAPRGEGFHGRPLECARGVNAAAVAAHHIVGAGAGELGPHNHRII